MKTSVIRFHDSLLGLVEFCNECLPELHRRGFIDPAGHEFGFVEQPRLWDAPPACFRCGVTCVVPLTDEGEEKLQKVLAYVEQIYGEDIPEYLENIRDLLVLCRQARYLLEHGGENSENSEQ